MTALAIDLSELQDLDGHTFDRRLLHQIDPLTVPVQYIVFAYPDMCEERQCCAHMRGNFTI